MMLEAKGVHKIYNHAVARLCVLRDVNLKVCEGEFLTIVGPSGAGKSTLLHILGGLDKPSEGKVFLGDRDLYALNDRDRANMRNQKIGFVFQFYHLLPELTALENIMLPAFIKNDMAQKEMIRNNGLSLLEKVGLTARQAHKPNQLSGGEQQRVAIARALINQPKIIFCDEPTGNLDSKSGQEIIELLMDLNRKNKQTLVMVTHDKDIAKRSGRTIHINDGKLVN